MLAEIIAVGSEMLTPHRQDTNSLHITAGLNRLGVSVAFKSIVGDNAKHLTDAITIALGRADIVVLCGGLGPTEDDLTRECVAEALGLKLQTHAQTLEAIQQRFARLRRVMSPTNAKQAMILEGATVLKNENGTAPGQFLDVAVAQPDGLRHRKIIVLLPGPPREMKPLFDGQCTLLLSHILPPRYIATRMLRMVLLPESHVDERTSPIYKQFTDVETTILAGHGEIQLHFTCAKPTLEEAEARVNTLAALVEQEMGDDIVSAHGETLEEIVLLQLGLHNHTLAVAESCTGGQLSERLTSVPNSSRVFLGGAVTYSNALKNIFCGVPQDELEIHGAVNAETARALAEGIRTRTGSTLGIGITGIAGPTRGSGADADKPIGLVYVALTDGTDTQVKTLEIPGERDRVRLWTVQNALEMLRRYLLHL